jgi:hypothetical protein
VQARVRPRFDGLIEFPYPLGRQQPRKVQFHATGYLKLTKKFVLLRHRYPKKPRDYLARRMRDDDDVSAEGDTRFWCHGC